MIRRLGLAVLLAALMGVLAGCASSSRSKGGGYYLDDGPGSQIPANVLSTPDAVPRIETLARANMRPYSVFGRRYVPISASQPFRQTGTASWYGRKFHGNRTANGEVYDMYAMTAAHPTLPLPSYARVTHRPSGRTVIVRVNDRGPFHSNRIIDLSYAAAARLGLIGPGSGPVVVEAITHNDIRQGSFASASPAAPAPVAPAPVSRPPVPSPVVTPPPTAAAQPAPLPPIPVEPARPDALMVLQDPAAAPLPAAVSAGTPGVYLQFGAFGTPDNAESLVSRVNQQIGTIESRRAHVHNADPFFRVQIGPYPTRTEAVNAAFRIQQETGLQPSIAVR